VTSGNAGQIADKKDQSSTGENIMSVIEKTIEVNVSVHTVYNHWTKFAEFPRFIVGVVQVLQNDDNHLHWKVSIAGKEKEWDAAITEQSPDRRIAWESYRGAKNRGVVTFEQVDAEKTKINLHVDYQPQGMVEKVGDAVGVVSRSVEGDLEQFKEFLESFGWKPARGEAIVATANK
jgi:uncharacterized membrane protein